MGKQVVTYTSLVPGYPRYPVSSQGTSYHFCERGTLTHSTDITGVVGGITLCLAFLSQALQKQAAWALRMPPWGLQFGRQGSPVNPQTEYTVTTEAAMLRVCSWWVMMMCSHHPNLDMPTALSGVGQRALMG